MQDDQPTTINERVKPEGSKGAAKQSGKRRVKSRARKIWGRIGLTALVLFLLMGIAATTAFIYLYSTTRLPDPNSDFTTNTTFIYYNDGEQQLGSLAVQNRVTLDYADMPQVMKDAVVAAENETFFTDPGFSLPGMLRGLFTIMSGGDVQGGSTITQQYIKILYLDSERTATRKIRELILAMKMGREVTKEEILEGYLNTVYFGRGAYGIEAAAKSYFLKPSAELSIPEAATLAAVLNNPAGLNPSGGEAHRERLLGRYQYVISQMLANGYITQAEYDAAYPALPEFPEVPISDRYGGPKGFLVAAVESEMAALGFSDAEVQGGGLKIITTVNQSMQDSAVATAQKYTEQAAAEAATQQDPSQLHVAISSIDTTTGGILAMYGGPDYVTNSRNWAMTPRPAASTFKSFAAVAGLRNGYSLDSQLNGNTFTPRGDSTTIRNEFGQQYGTVTLRRAVAESINTAFVDMTENIPDGAQAVIQAANDAGAPTGAGWDPNNRIALGAAEVSPTNMAAAYATFADSGRYKAPHIVAKVLDRHGNVVYEADTSGTQNIEPNVAANVTDAMTSVVEEGTGTKASALGRPVAGKTGTNGVDDAITSAWFVGYTRQISTAVMYVAGEGGNDDLEPYKRPQDQTFFGSSYPLMTWVEYMQAATEGQEVLSFDKANPISGKSVSPSPGASETPSVEPTPTPMQTATQPTPTALPTTDESTPTPTPEPSQPDVPSAAPSVAPSPTGSSEVGGGSDG